MKKSKRITVAINLVGYILVAIASFWGFKIIYTDVEPYKICIIVVIWIVGFSIAFVKYEEPEISDTVIELVKEGTKDER